MTLTIYLLCVKKNSTWPNAIPGTPCYLKHNDWGPSPTWRVCEEGQCPPIFFSKKAAENFRKRPANPYLDHKERPLGWDQIEPLMFEVKV